MAALIASVARRNEPPRIYALCGTTAHREHIARRRDANGFAEHSHEASGANSLQSQRVSDVLAKFFNDAEKGDAAIKEQLAKSSLSMEDAIRQMVAKAVQSEKGGIENLNGRAENYFAVSRDFGKFLGSCLQGTADC